MPMIEVRKMLKIHRAGVRSIDRQVFEKPWDDVCWKLAMTEHGMRCRVAFLGDTVVGFVVFHVKDDRVEIVRMGVSAEMRRRGVGSTLMGAVMMHLNVRRPRIVVPILDCDHEAQDFFRAQGFKATGVVRQFAQSSHDCFVLTYRMEVKAAQ